MLFAGVKFWFKTKVSVATLSIDEIHIKIKNAKVSPKTVRIIVLTNVATSIFKPLYIKIWEICETTSGGSAMPKFTFLNAAIKIRKKNPDRAPSNNGIRKLASSIKIIYSLLLFLNTSV